MPDIIYRAIEKNELRHIVLDELEVRIPAQMRDIVNAASDEIVQTNNLVTLRKQQIGEVRSNKPGSAGDNRNRTVFAGNRFFAQSHQMGGHSLCTRAGEHNGHCAQ